MKNKKHSDAIKELNQLKWKYNTIQNHLRIAKNLYIEAICDPFEYNFIKEYEGDIKDARWLLNSLAEDIKSAKQEVYKAQYLYNKNK